MERTTSGFHAGSHARRLALLFGILAVGVLTLCPTAGHGQAPKPASPSPRTEEDFLKTKLEWFIRETAGAYEKEAKKKSVFDEKIARFLKDFAVDGMFPDQGIGQAKLIEAGDSIVKAGCKDPLVLRAYACLLSGAGREKEARPLFRQALEGFQNSPYPRVNLFYSAFNSLPSESEKGTMDKDTRTYLEETALDALAETIADGEFGPGEYNIALRLIEFTASEVIEGNRHEKMVQSLHKHKNADPWFLQAFTGYAEVDKAWEIRGSGWAKDVKPESWQGFAEHLGKGRVALTKAWQLRPEYPETAERMIRVVMAGAGGPGESEKTWFNRALAAEADYSPAYTALLWAYRPRWGGNFKAMYTVGLECLNGGRFDTYVPMVYLVALQGIAEDYPIHQWRGAYRHPDISKNLDRMFEGMLKGKNAIKEKARQIILAQQALANCWCGNYERARDILASLPKDMTLKNGYFGMPLTWEGMDKKRVEGEIRAFTGPQKAILEKAENLSIEGKTSESLRLFEQALEASRGDDLAYQYILDRVGILRLPEPDSEKTGGHGVRGRWYAIHHAIRANRTDVARYLIEKGVDLNARAFAGRTPLMEAIAENQSEIVDLLLEKGSDINAKSQSGCTPLFYALIANNESIALRLIQMGADVNARHKDGNAPLGLALRYGQPKAAQVLVAKGADINATTNDGWTPLHFALRYGNPDAANYFISKGADINAKTVTNWTPLLFALQDRKLQVANELLNRGAALNVRNRFHWAALHMAIQYEQPAMAMAMIQKGADVNMPGDTGLTPLHYAVHHKYADVVLLLLEKGAKIDAPDDKGYTPLHLAVWENSPDMMRLLLDKGANIDAADQLGCTALMLALEKKMSQNAAFLIERRANIRATTKNGDNALHYAALGGCADVARILLARGVDRNAKDKDGDTALDVAKKHNQQEVVDILSKP